MTRIGLKFKIFCTLMVALGCTCIYYGIKSGLFI